MAFIGLKNLLGALFGTSIKPVLFGLLLMTAGLVGYSTALKKASTTHVAAIVGEVNKQAMEVNGAVRRSTSKARQSTERLNHALEKHKTWSDVRVPDDVVNELCAKVNCGESTDSVQPSSSKSQDSRGTRQRH